MAIPRHSINDFTPEIFHRLYKIPNQPVIITDAIQRLVPHSAEPLWGLNKMTALLGEQTQLKARHYGKGQVDQPLKWPTVGYCQQKLLTVQEYVTKLTQQEAARDDIYVVDDIANTPAGRLLQPQFDNLAKCLGLALSDMGSYINAWWGPPGHREPLHCDIIDGTLWQLYGQKHIVLVPDRYWEHLYPFGIESKMSWGFSQVNLLQPDFKQFPKLREALANALIDTLYPGEILYIPACWGHEITGQGVDHILSVQRFWHTSLRKLIHLPEEVLNHIIPVHLRGELLSLKKVNARVTNPLSVPVEFSRKT